MSVVVCLTIPWVFFIDDMHFICLNNLGPLFNCSPCGHQNILSCGIELVPVQMLTLIFRYHLIDCFMLLQCNLIYTNHCRCCSFLPFCGVQLIKYFGMDRVAQLSRLQKRLTVALVLMYILSKVSSRFQSYRARQSSNCQLTDLIAHLRT